MDIFRDNINLNHKNCFLKKLSSILDSVHDSNILNIIFKQLHLENSFEEQKSLTE